MADEIQYLVSRSGVNYFDIADTTFNVPRSHAIAVCEEIVRRGLDFRFEVELSPLEQDEESVGLAMISSEMKRWWAFGTPPRAS